MTRTINLAAEPEGTVPCLTADPDLFFDLRKSAAAKAVCAGCPFRDVCMAQALHDERGLPVILRYGVFGGLTPQERHDTELRMLAGDCADCGEAGVPGRLTCLSCEKRRGNTSRDAEAKILKDRSWTHPPCEVCGAGVATTSPLVLCQNCRWQSGLSSRDQKAIIEARKAS